MIDVDLHPCGQPAQTVTLAAVPRVGDLVDLEGQLYRVAVVLFQGEHVAAYSVLAAEDVASELAGWSDSPTAKTTEATP